jgi:hypothetical protein
MAVAEGSSPVKNRKRGNLHIRVCEGAEDGNILIYSAQLAVAKEATLAPAVTARSHPTSGCRPCRYSRI